MLGRIIQINGESRTIVGVMPRGVSLPGPLAGDDDLWMPARLSAADRVTEVYHSQKILGRLADGIDRRAGVCRARGACGATRGGTAVAPAAGRAAWCRSPNRRCESIRPALLLIAGSVGLLLLVACANASTLLLARASNRRHELAVRTALGATRGRLLSLAVAESLVFASLGGLAGLLLGGWALRAVLPLFASSLPAAIPIDIDARVAVFTAAVSAVLGLLFGIVVASHRPEGGLVDLLKASGRTIAGSAGRARNALVIAQVALAVVLLSAAGLMLNSVVKLSRVRPGFDADHLLTFKVALSGSNYGAAPARVALRLGSARAPDGDGRRAPRGALVDRPVRRAARRQRLRDRRATGGARTNADRRPALRLAELSSRP